MAIVINKDEVAKNVVRLLPTADEDTVRRITEDIVRDIAPVLYSHIRKLTLRERESLYFGRKAQ